MKKNFTAGDRTPYTYLIGWTKQNTWYYGVRYKRRCHPDDLWNPYKTSSKHVKRFVEAYGEPDVIKVRKVFNSVEQALKTESYVLGRMDVRNSPLWLNMTNGNKDFCFTGEKASATMSMVRAKRKGSWGTTDGMNNEKRAELGMVLIPGRPKGSKTSDEARAKLSEFRKGKVRVKGEDGVVFLALMDNPEIGVGLEVVPLRSKGFKGKPHTEEHKKYLSEIAKKRPVMSCPLCNQDIQGLSNFNRHKGSKRCLERIQAPL